MNKLTKLNEIIEREGLDGLIVTNAANRRYLTNFTGSNGILIISKQENIMITDYRYVEQAKIQTKGLNIILHEDHTGHKGSKSTIYKKIVEQIRNLDLKKIGFEKDAMIYGLYNLLSMDHEYELIPTLDLIEDMRMIKAEDEIENLKTSTEILDETFEYIIDFIKPGVKEIQVSEMIQNFVKNQGATTTGFLPTVASGYRGALAHGRASEKVIEEGEMVVIDFGVNYNSYWSDVTRTFAVGKPDAELKEIYHIVLEALERSLSVLKPGVFDTDVNNVIKEYIESYGYSKFAGTGTGHGLGIEVHENPYLSTKKDKKIKPGMVLAIEPGIYLPGKGGVRIEDNVLVTETGYKNWTNTPRELLIL